jgi:hypothetical protein
LRFGNLEEDKTQHLLSGVFMALVIMEIVLAYQLLVAKFILMNVIIPIPL